MRPSIARERSQLDGLCISSCIHYSFAARDLNSLQGKCMLRASPRMNTILVPYHLDEMVDVLPFPDALAIQPGDLPDAPPWERLAALYDPVADAVAAADRPLVVSGDCTTSLGTLAGLQRKGCDPAIAWFDAHGDFNTHETTLSGYLGGMPLALPVGRGDPTLRDRLDLRPVPENRVILGEARDLDPPERLALDASAGRRGRVARGGR